MQSRTVELTQMQRNVTRNALKTEVEKVKNTPGISPAEKAVWIVELEEVLTKMSDS